TRKICCLAVMQFLKLTMASGALVLTNHDFFWCVPGTSCALSVLLLWCLRKYKRQLLHFPAPLLSFLSCTYFPSTAVPQVALPVLFLISAYASTHVVAWGSR